MNFSSNRYCLLSTESNVLQSIGNDSVFTGAMCFPTFDSENVVLDLRGTAEQFEVMAVVNTVTVNTVNTVTGLQPTTMT